MSVGGGEGADSQLAAAEQPQHRPAAPPSGYWQFRPGNQGGLNDFSPYLSIAEMALAEVNHANYYKTCLINL